MNALSSTALLLTLVTAQAVAADNMFKPGKDFETTITRQLNNKSMSSPLKPCPDRPNCVSSEAHPGRSYIAPLGFSGSGEHAWQALQKVILDMDGQIENSNDHFIHAIFHSRIFRFADDLTCRLDSDNYRIHIRSAARVGYYDFGVNRRRLEQIRKEFHAIIGRIPLP